MSRIAKKPIVVPSSVDISLNNNNIIVSSKNKSLTLFFHSSVKIQYENDTLLFYPIYNKYYGWMQSGTVRSLVNSMIIGVTLGFSKKLQLVGVGYRFSMEKNNIIVMSLGYSHLIKYFIPSEITINIISATEIVLKSFNKQLLGQITANLRKKRKPEPYKGKGIRYFNEYIRIKEAKKK